MTQPKDKARELVERFSPKCSGNSQSELNKELAKQCAVICCDEIISALNTCILCKNSIREYWNKVKESIIEM